MTTQAKHRPLPWFVTEGGRHVRKSTPGTVEMIADCSETGRPDDECANAAFIVQACNAHHQLVEALKEVVAALRENAPGTALNNHRFDALGIKCHKALALAEKGME